MRKIFIALTFCTLTVALLDAQSTVITFTGRDSINHHVPLSRVVVTNITKGWQETLFWPDTVLLMSATGVDDYMQQNGLILSQNNPNPFDGCTFVNLQVSEIGDVDLLVADITGRVVASNHFSPQQPGSYEIRITLSSVGVYFLMARQNGRTASVKMVNCGNGGANVVAIFDIVGTNNDSPLLQHKNAYRGTTDNLFDLGDLMEFVGYAVINGEELESRLVMQELYVSQTITFSFTYAKPCPNIPTVTDRDGNVYNTVQIGDQCWMRENLRTTKYANGASIPAGSTWSNTDPYYYDYSSSNIPLEERGYLYNWPAAMHQSTGIYNPGSQGICPTGWHIPSGVEWAQLTNYLSSQEEYICGNDSNQIAKAMASTSWWGYFGFEWECAPGNQSVYANNTSGFGAVPAGYWCNGFYHTNRHAYFWTSRVNYNNYVYGCYLQLNTLTVKTDYDATKYYGYSVRCLHD